MPKIDIFKNLNTKDEQGFVKKLAWKKASSSMKGSQHPDDIEEAKLKSKKLFRQILSERKKERVAREKSRAKASPKRAKALPKRVKASPKRVKASPKRVKASPKRAKALPKRVKASPKRVRSSVKNR